MCFFAMPRRAMTLMCLPSLRPSIDCCRSSSFLVLMWSFAVIPICNLTASWARLEWYTPAAWACHSARRAPIGFCSGATRASSHSLRPGTSRRTHSEEYLSPGRKLCPKQPTPASAPGRNAACSGQRGTEVNTSYPRMPYGTWKCGTSYPRRGSSRTADANPYITQNKAVGLKPSFTRAIRARKNRDADNFYLYFHILMYIIGVKGINHV